MCESGVRKPGLHGASRIGFNEARLCHTRAGVLA
jgi:hypothetical protein